jgi:large subunit ribosomal protein L3
MSENQEAVNTTEAAPEAKASGALKLHGLFAHKVGMTSIYDEQGNLTSVTVLKFDPWFVSQIKTLKADGYEAVQIASSPKKAVLTSNAEKVNMKKAGFENGARFVKEIRGAVPAGASLGQKVDIDSLAKGDVVKITSKSKGKGFQGSMKRHNFQGGPAAHGSKFHRQPGSSGNRTWPGRVMPGKKFPGHMGDENITVKSVKVLEVLAEEGLLLVKGPVPGSKNTLVKLMKE